MSEKAGSGCPGDEFLGLGKSGWKPLAVSRRKNLPGSAQLKANAFVLTSWKGQKTNSGFIPPAAFLSVTFARQRAPVKPYREW